MKRKSKSVSMRGVTAADIAQALSVGRIKSSDLRFFMILVVAFLGELQGRLNGEDGPYDSWRKDALEKIDAILG